MQKALWVTVFLLPTALQAETRNFSTALGRISIISEKALPAATTGELIGVIEKASPHLVGLPKVENLRVHICQKNCADLYVKTSHELFINFQSQTIAGALLPRAQSRPVWLHEIGHAVFEEFMREMPWFRELSDEAHKYEKLTAEKLELVNALWPLHHGPASEAEKILRDVKLNPHGLSVSSLIADLKKRSEDHEKRIDPLRSSMSRYDQVQEIARPYSELAADLLPAMVLCDPKALYSTLFSSNRNDPMANSPLVKARDMSASIPAKGWLAGTLHPDPHIVLSPSRSVLWEVASCEAGHKLSFLRALKTFRDEISKRVLKEYDPPSPESLNQGLLQRLAEVLKGYSSPSENPFGVR